MNSSLKRGLFLVTVIGTISVSGEQAEAADERDAALPGVGIEQVLNDCYAADEDFSVEDYLVPTVKGEYLDMAFTNVSADTFLFVRSEPTRESEWVGKLYPDSASEIIGPVGEWTKVQSGTVTGYVYTEYIITGNEAEERARDLAESSGAEDIREVVQHAESREEEEARLAEEKRVAEEEAARVAEEQAEEASTLGQAVVDYACQFIGNPYVWGGTSLTEGADCSGFVQSVYAHFGISLPRTTWDQEYSGIGISYSEAMPGDLILYEGHVGIYIGNGQIVNAINASKGIGIIPATCMSIKTVRRVI
ncbi:MAG: C40 family peptidase [Eubacteriales bacterium]|nr:C40 family peptidase [Eubacteriales bacterium]